MAIHSPMNSDFGVHSGMQMPKSQLRRNDASKDEFSKIFQSKTTESKQKLNPSDANEKKIEDVKPREKEKNPVSQNRDKFLSKPESQVEEKDVSLEAEETAGDKSSTVVLEDFLALLNHPQVLELSPEEVENLNSDQMPNAEVIAELESLLQQVSESGVSNSDLNLKTDTVTPEEVSNLVTETMIGETNVKDIIKKALNMASNEMEGSEISIKSEAGNQDDMKLYPVPEKPMVVELNAEPVEKELTDEVQSLKILSTQEEAVKTVVDPKVQDEQGILKMVEKEEVSDKISLVQAKEVQNPNFQQMLNKQPVGVFSQEPNPVFVKNPIVNQVFEMIRGPITLSESGTMLKMKLQPEELGQVQLKLSLQKGLVLAEIKVENELVKAAMESNLDQLKQNLSNKGFQVSQVSVAVDLNNKDQAQSQFGQSNHGQNQQSNKYFEAAEEFNDESIFEALQLKDRGIGTAIDYSG